MSRWLPVHVYVAVEGELVDIVVDANSIENDEYNEDNMIIF